MAQTIFVPRTVAPTSDEFWYRSGTNPCIKRLNGTVLPNCFAGGTQIITNEGVMTLKKAYEYCKTASIEVPTLDGEWHTAKVKYFGVQKLYKVEFESSTYFCTANHRWIIQTKKGYRVVQTTELLPSMKIPFRMCNTEPHTHPVAVTPLGKSEGVYCVVEPITKSFTLSGGEITGNCVGYAHGRFCEILGEFHKDLPTCDAGKWLDTIKNSRSSLQWGTTPRLGAVAVWKREGKAGHVAVVEYLNSDGSIMLSESGYSSGWGNRFWNSGPQYGPRWHTNTNYEFQGFIYNPGTEHITQIAPYEGGIAYGVPCDSISETYEDICRKYSESGLVINRQDSLNRVPQSFSPTEVEHPARKFVRTAMSHLGRGSHDWVMELTKVGKNQAWSTATCCAVSKECGFDLVIPTKAYSGYSFASTMINQLGGKYMMGGAQGGQVKPQVGDIFAIFTGARSAANKFSASRIGIVRELQGTIVLTIEGDLQGNILLNKRRIQDIYWYIRPNWTKMNASENCDSLLVSPIYDSLSTKEDAMLREVSYLNDQCEPSIKSTDIKLSAINYTTTLSNLMSYYSNTNPGVVSGFSVLENRAVPLSNSYHVDGTQLQPPNARIIFDYLISKGLSAAQSIGFLANIQAESGFLPSSVNSSSGASGICQWLGSRKTEMIKFCGSDWSNNLSGQLDFLWSELNGSESSTLKKLVAEVTENTEAAAEQAADLILKNFERPGYYDINTPKRKGYARDLWNMIVVIDSSTGSFIDNGTGNSIITQSGKKLTQGELIPVPSSTVQSGISYDCDYYDQKFSTWNRKVAQGKLADIWNKQMRPMKYNIATISGYFLICIDSKYGLAGDIISVVLTDGTYFNAIIADNEDVRNIFKWESLSTLMATSRINALKQSGWYQKKVVKIINYGSWLEG